MSLPLSIHQYIWSLLDLPSINKAKRVCKYWNKNLNENVWRLICERHGYKDKPKEKSHQWYYLSKQPFKKEKFTGVGQKTVLSEKLNIYEGEFVKGYKEGYGRFYIAGEIYQGYYKNGKKDGHGKYTWPDGDSYVGQWKNDKQQGEGTYTWSNGSKYSGLWKDDRRDGYGVYTWPCDDCYQGEFTSNNRYGYGIYTWLDGRYYIGQWKSTRNGIGHFRWPDGSEYIGEWKDSRRHGRGIMKWYDGTSICGEWVEDLIKDPPNNRWNGFFILYTEEQRKVVKEIVSSIGLSKTLR